MRSLSSSVLSTSTRKTIGLGSVIIKSEVIFLAPKLTFSVSEQANRLVKPLFAGRSKRSQRQGARKIDERRRTAPVRCSEAIERNEAYESFSAACQCFVHNLLCLAHHRVQVRFIFEGLRVDLVDVFRA